MMPKIGIEDSRSVAAIMPVMTAAFDPAFGEAWSSAQCIGALGLPGSWMTVARVNDSAVAFAIVRSVLEEAELMLVATHPEWRGKGIGSAILNHVVDQCLALGVEKLHVEVRHDNPALSFYEKHQFGLIGRRKNYYKRQDGQVADALTLCRLCTKRTKFSIEF